MYKRAGSVWEETSIVTDLFGHRQALGVGDRGEFLLPQLLNSVFVISQIQLGTNEDDGSVGTMVSHLGVPLQRDHSNDELRRTLKAQLQEIFPVGLHNYMNCYRNLNTDESSIKNVQEQQFF